MQSRVPAGLLAAAIFTQLPTILAHSAVATTDVALTVMFCWSLDAFTLRLQKPNWRTAANFGVATDLASRTRRELAAIFWPH
jgi:4-amino-4-deoxy-L-arabinose transferase-like glycosyltransferase